MGKPIKEQLEKYQNDSKILNIGIKTRFVVVFSEFFIRIIIIIFNLLMLIVQLLLLLSMIFRQKTFNNCIDTIRKNIDDFEKTEK